MKGKILMVAFSVVCSFSFALGLSASEENTGVEMKVKRVFLDPSSRTPVVILETIREKKFIPIWIGKAEATSIAIGLEQATVPRPNTHDLIRNILEGLGAVLHHITITDLRNNTYFAVITLKLEDQEFKIDSRPSDAIAVALRTKAPIYASPEVLAKANKLPSQFEQSEGVRKILGFHMQDLTAELATLFGLQMNRGVLVADVELGSAASKAGFQRGDVITEINDKEVHNIGQLESFFNSIKKPVQVNLQVQRKGKPMVVVLDLPS